MDGVKPSARFQYGVKGQLRLYHLVLEHRKMPGNQTQGKSQQVIPSQRNHMSDQLLISYGDLSAFTNRPKLFLCKFAIILLNTCNRRLLTFLFPLTRFSEALSDFSMQSVSHLPYHSFTPIKFP